MSFGILADYFEGAGAKHLTAVEVNRLRSNQHEFQGVSGFRSFLGQPSGKRRFATTFYWLDDDGESEPLRAESFCTWSNVRRGNPDRAAEYHLYYAAGSEPVVRKASAGDLLVVARTRQDTLLAMICPAGTTIAQQLLWLFGLDLLANRVDARALGAGDGVPLGFAARAVLDDLGIDLAGSEPDAFGRLIGRFGLVFPGTAAFSAFARETFGAADPVACPDETLVGWMDHEEALFRHLERRVVADRLDRGFVADGTADVDGFVAFSLSVLNRRKSRAGWAFGHHVEAVLAAAGLRFTREATTEKRNGPDFLFPGEAAYHDRDFDAGSLTMLAAKTSCKDRWRQVLAEAHRIGEKHLLTLQPGISETQTAEMRAERLRLVVPRPIFGSYLPAQRDWLMDVAGFIAVARARQA